MIKLYDLAARDDRIRFSPFCWRTKMALKHKGLMFDTIAWRFTEKDALHQTSQGRVPVLVDGTQWLHDSWAIALYLDQTYPDRPALMRSDAERAVARFVNNWCDLVLHPTLRPLLFLDIYKIVAEKDRAYFRGSREKLLGTTLEDFCADREKTRRIFLSTIEPIEKTLAQTQFLGGREANYCDHILFGSLQWVNVVSGTTLLQPNSAAAAWFERMLDYFGGYARNARTAAGAA